MNTDEQWYLEIIVHVDDYHEQSNKSYSQPGIRQEVINRLTANWEAAGRTVREEATGEEGRVVKLIID